MKLTRRVFLKIGFTSAAVAGWGGSLTGCFSPPGEVPRKVIRTAGRAASVPSTCLLCPAGCGIIGEVLDGRLEKIVGNPKHPNNRGKLCARGHAGVNVLYDPDRLLQPLKRSGGRGEGKWTRISWDQALEELAKRFADLRKSGRSEGLWVEMGMPGSQDLMALEFLKAFGSPQVFPEADGLGVNERFAHLATWGAESPVCDVARSRYILIFGANPYENDELYISLAQRIIEGKLVSAAKLVTFDVRNSNTAGRSNDWIPLKPGTDGIVALALAQHILQEGSHDPAFLSRWTNVPIPKLIEHLAPYTPEQAEKISGVRAADIRRVAMEFAHAKPAVALAGRGVSGHVNGVQNERCIALLNAVVGSIDIPGGCCLPRKIDLGAPGLKSPYASSFQALTALKEGKASPDIYWCYLANPAYATPHTAEVTRLLKDEKKIPFLVVADTHLTETGALADLLLPMTTYLESWNLESRPSMGLVPFVSIRQPIVAPLGRSMSLGDALAGLAKRLGEDLQKAFPFANGEEFMEKAAARAGGLVRGGGLEALKKDGVWFDPAAKPEYRIYEKKGFSTPSGKFEVSSLKVQEKGQPALPSYVPIQAHQELKEKEFILAVYQPGVMTRRLANSKWLAEILHASPLGINLRTAQSLGLKNGDRVKINSSAGSLTVPVRLTHGLHPKVVALPEGLGHWELGKIARAKKYRSNDFDTNELWWEQEGNGAHTNTVVPAQFDPAGGGAAWNDAVVTIEKI
ncbi:MAG: molybdopterin-dependent oxidoreductase [Syntrophaceae bacterium]|nr:molybdopterin-dependent oxidoreductase [Syntrophaceae bacterium]